MHSGLDRLAQSLLVKHTCVPGFGFGPICLQFVDHIPICLGPHEFTLVSYTCLPRLSPTLGVLGRMILHVSPTCFPHVSPTLDVLERMSLHLSPTLVSHTCLPLLFPRLVPHSGFFVLSLHWSPTCLPHLSPIRVPWFACTI